MPIYEYECKECGSQFEALVTASRKAECPQCHGEQLEKLFSTFATNSPGSTASHSASSGHTCSGPTCCGGACGMN